MSRYRPITTPYGDFGIDRKRDGHPAKHEQLEILAALLNVDMDDLFDGGHLTQGEVVSRVREIQGQVPPRQVIERQAMARLERQLAPACRICKREGDSTRHHFVNKWILKELAYYEQKWSSRTTNCIPVCVDCHRQLHDRDNGVQSIADRLTDEEKEYAEAALSALAEERPKLLILIARGDDNVYESRLVKDWIAGAFRTETPNYSPKHLRLVS